MPRPKAVRKRKGKSGWWASITDTSGRRREVCLGDTQAEATERLGEVLRLHRLGKLTPEVADAFRAGFRSLPEAGPNLGDAWADWKSAKAAKRSFSDDAGRWGILTEYLSEDEPLAGLTLRQVDDVLSELREDRDLSAASVNRYRALLRSVLNLQEGRTELGLDPRKIRTTPEAARQRVLSPEEVRRFIAHLDARIVETDTPKAKVRPVWLRELRFATKLALFTAARAGELGALTWADVDRAGGSVYFRETKAGGSRWVEVSPPCVALFTEWWALLGKPERTERVFVTDAKSVGKRFRREAAEAGIPDARFHDLRRTAASRMLEAGMDARTVQQVTGHRDLSVLLKVYNIPTESRRRQAVGVLGGVFGDL
ncbi:MAG TPA: site-specific integrase [Myxococcales bacterium LLY-WYZ-16_1]|nr:site-specific integrase [Myxococcales bacterium LLY-WYZ-16_1]